MDTTSSGAKEFSGPEGTVEKMQEQQQTSLPQERKKTRAMVAIDDSEESFYALKWVIDKLFNHPMPSPDETPEPLVQDSNLVTLVHVMEPLPHYAFPGGYVVESATKAQEKNAAKILSRASQICKEKKVAAETLILEGDPKETICQAVEKMNIDVLVVGSRGLGQIKRAFLGSVSDYCAHHAKCPVVIVKLPKESHK